MENPPSKADWDDAYDNGGHIDGAAGYAPKWAKQALAFRDALMAAGRADLDLAYGPQERDKLDLFRPIGTARGLAVFAHGGFWKAFDKSTWSHLAGGALARGWAVCVPSYTLAPQARIGQITDQFARAVQFAAQRIEGPIRLAGHSAGGHLVCRMVCQDGPLQIDIWGRIEHVLSISGVHDLRPLRHTTMNEILGLDEAEAARESVALHRPLEPCSITCWVGADERPAFVAQNDLLARVWSGPGAMTESVHAPGRHHFNVIDDLCDPETELTKAFIG
ncbi:MAG TPA: alpha/beta hydrolase [Rhodospirillales bacterium]|nr:alpha/beta hydrolase [Rhodospirillales bacterium]